MEGDELKKAIAERTGLSSSELECPRERSVMTPCVARDGDIAMLDDKKCVGCLANVVVLLNQELSHEKKS